MTASAPGSTVTSAAEETLREVVETLAAYERGPGSPGEERAARWLAERLERTGCVVQIDEEQCFDGYAKVIGGLAAAGALAGGAALTRRLRAGGGAAAAAVTGAIADDSSNGPRFVRRTASPAMTTWNVVARCGDLEADRRLVVLAHHDAAPTGAIFDDRAQAWFGERFPGLLERVDTSLPLWWAMLAAPALVAAGAATKRRGLIASGLAGCLLGTAVFGDVARSPVCPGANDNLTAVAVLVALAERLAEQPLRDLQVVLASCGAEEVIQGGIYGFVERHLRPLDRERTWVLNLDTLGSPRLILLEGEGPVVMEDYTDRSFRDFIARTADHAGVPLRRGMRARNSTDAVIPSRAGYATATLSSMDRYKALSNYHKMSDTPENVRYPTVLQALTVSESLARRLADDPWVGR